MYTTLTQNNDLSVVSPTPHTSSSLLPQHFKSTLYPTNHRLFSCLPIFTLTNPVYKQIEPLKHSPNTHTSFGRTQPPYILTTPNNSHLNTTLIHIATLTLTHNSSHETLTTLQLTQEKTRSYPSPTPFHHLTQPS